MREGEREREGGPEVPHLQPSVLASQLTSCASTAFLEVGQVMQPCPETLATHRAREATRIIIILSVPAVSLSSSSSATATRGSTLQLY